MEKLNLVNLPHLASVENLSAEEVETLINRVEYFRNGGATPHLTQPVYISDIFFEDLSRTHASFEMAERKLGLAIIPFNPAHSSINKSGTLHDTSLIMDAVGVNIEIIRHSQNGYYQNLIRPKEYQHLNIGVINAGDGSRRRPGQCLLDMTTAHEHFNRFKGLKVTIVGDITNSHVAKNSIELLTRLGAEVYFSGPEYWYSSEYDKYGEYEKLSKLIPEMNVMMLLRVQHERHSDDLNEKSFGAQTYHEEYGINHKRYQELEPNTIIMHSNPINHNVELSGDLVESDKCMFTRQMQSGIFMRMAMIEAALRGRKLGGFN